MDRQAELLRHHRLGPAGRELRAVPREGSPRRDRRSTRVARVGRAGRIEAPGRRGRRRERPVPRRSPGRRVVLCAGRCDRSGAATTSPPPRPTTTFHSRSDRMAPKKQQPRRRTGPTTAPGKRKSCHFCRDKVAGDRLQEPRAAPPLHLREGEDPLAPDHGRLPAAPDPGRGGGEAGARDGAPSRTWARR